MKHKVSNTFPRLVDLSASHYKNDLITNDKHQGSFSDCLPDSCFLEMRFQISAAISVVQLASSFLQIFSDGGCSNPQIVTNSMGSSEPLVDSQPVDLLDFPEADLTSSATARLSFQIALWPVLGPVCFHIAWERLLVDGGP